MDELELVNTNINFVFEFKTPNGYLPLGYNKYSLPINIFHNTENIYTTDYTIITNSMNNPSEYSARNASYPIALLERGKHIHRVLLKDLNEETINPNEIYVLCFESFSTEILFQYYADSLNRIDNMISPKLLNLVKTKENFKILFVDIWEGSYPHDYLIFDNINNFLNTHNISQKNKVFVSSCNVLIENMDDSKINPTAIQRIKTFTNGNYIYEAGNYISQLRASESNEIVENDYEYSIQDKIIYNPKPKKFLMYNRNTSRLHRPWFVKQLYDNNLLKSGYVSLIQNDEFEERLNKDITKIHELDLTKSDMDGLVNSYKSFYPLNIDETDGERIAWLHNYLSRRKEYEETYFTIVGETNAEAQYLFITEKTLKPIMNLHPFFIVGNPYTIKYLKKLGFNTFSDFWDESYDEQPNFKLRCEMIVTEVKKLCEKSDTEMLELLKNMEDILHHNKKLLHSFYTKNKREQIFRENIIK
jgi:hypothetical protein